MDDAPEQRITMVKKIMPDGTPCQKCIEVEDRLNASGYIQQIDRIVIADSTDIGSEGMLLAQVFGVEHAPFFIVEKAGQEPAIYTVYLKFVKEVLKKSSN